MSCYVGLLGNPRAQPMAGRIETDGGSLDLDDERKQVSSGRFFDAAVMASLLTYAALAEHPPSTLTSTPVATTVRVQTTNEKMFFTYEKNDFSPLKRHQK